MKWLPLTGILLGLLIASTVRAQDATSQLIERFDRCIEHQFQSGQAARRNQTIELASECRALHEAADHPLLANLEPPLGDKPSLAQLLDIRSLLIASRQSASGEARLDYTGLAQLVEETYQAEQEDKAEDSGPGIIDRLFDAFLDWLKEIFADADEQDFNWLDNQSADSFILLFKVILVMLILLVLLLIANELRAANLFAAWRHLRKRHRAKTGPVYLSGQVADSVDLETLPDKAFVSHILYRVLGYLMQQEYLPEKFSFTNRELLIRAPDKNADLQRLIDDSEAVIYGDKSCSTNQRQQLLGLMQKLTRPMESAG